MTVSSSLGMRYHVREACGTRMTAVWLATVAFEDARGMDRGALTVAGLTGALRCEDSRRWYLGSARFTSEQVVSGRNAA